MKLIYKKNMSGTDYEFWETNKKVIDNDVFLEILITNKKGCVVNHLVTTDLFREKITFYKMYPLDDYFVHKHNEYIEWITEALAQCEDPTASPQSLKRKKKTSNQQGKKHE